MLECLLLKEELYSLDVIKNINKANGHVVNLLPFL